MRQKETLLFLQESGIIHSRQFYPMGLFVPNNRPDYTMPHKAFGMSEFLLPLALVGAGIGSALVAFVYRLSTWKGREALGKTNNWT